MTPSVQPDTWTPQVWSHADILDMQARLDPVRMTEYADHWRRVIDGARGVLVRLHEDVTGHLADSWWGHAGRHALEVLRGYISEALDGLTRCRSLADALQVLSDASSELRSAIDGLEHVDDLTDVREHYSDPAVAAGNAVGEIPHASTGSGRHGIGAARARRSVTRVNGAGRVRCRHRPPDTAVAITGIAP